MKVLKLLREHPLFIPLCIYVVVSQWVILAPHLEYGFSDVDWGFLYYYHQALGAHPNIIANFMETFKYWGVYAHQSYYIGIQSHFFWLDYEAYQTVIHIFKILATISVYPLAYIISKNKLLAVVTTILFSVSYPAVGTMYTVVTSSDYTALLTMVIFLLVYWKMAEQKLNTAKWLMLLAFFYLATLFLSTERMYPLLFMIPLVEVFAYLKNKGSYNLKFAFARLLILFFPAMVGFLYKPALFANFLSQNGVDLVTRVASGEYHLLLTPVVSLGSLILPHTYWNALGSFDKTSYFLFMRDFMSGLFLVITILTVTFSFVAIQRKTRFVVVSLLATLSLVTLVYFLDTKSTTEFASVLVKPALNGSFILSVAVASYIEWQSSRERLLIGLFLMPILSLVYIILTWIAADTTLVFTGVHRYLTVPGLFIAFFIGSAVVLFYQKAYEKKRKVFKFVALLPYVILVPFVIISVWQIHEFFNSQLMNGFGAYDKNLIRGQVLDQVENLSSTDPSLFYFDYSGDYQLGYYYDNAVLAGFGTWMLVGNREIYPRNMSPGLMFEPPAGRSLLFETFVSDGEKTGFSYGDRFYDIENFYAFKLQNKVVTDIRDEVLSELSTN